ncbi:MAG: glutamate racemase [Clostridia bacterium]
MIKIGVLDSGIGGITTCSAILHRLGGVDIIYYADNKNLPYGAKRPHEIFVYVEKGIEYFIERGVDLVVLACNTATASVIEALRARFSINIVGIEPAIKPALRMNGSILYLATPLTYKIKRQAQIVEDNKSRIVTCDTTMLASKIENCLPNFDLLENLTSELLNGFDKVENLVLGCTHYCFLRPSIAKLFPNKLVFDGNDGVALRVQNLLNVPFCDATAHLYLHFSGEDESTKYLQSLMSYNTYISSIVIDID